MTTDLWMLVATSMLCFVAIVIYGSGRFSRPGGRQWAAGNREAEFAAPAWSDRAVRAHLNLIENLVPFAILVLVAQVSGKANATTALGATIFFWARVAHLVLYVAGVQWLRTMAWFVSWVGGFMILFQILH